MRAFKTIEETPTPSSTRLSNRSRGGRGPQHSDATWRAQGPAGGLTYPLVEYLASGIDSPEPPNGNQRATRPGRIAHARPRFVYHGRSGGSRGRELAAVVANGTQATFDDRHGMLLCRPIIPSPGDLMLVDRRVEYEQLGSSLVY